MKFGAILAAIIFAAVFSFEAFTEEGEKKIAYVGDNAKNCKACHSEQVKIMSATKMFAAWEGLPPETRSNPDCFSCHVTGYGNEGGFVSLEETPQLKDVQCEACHGPAGDHIKNPMKVKPANNPREACFTCHNDEVLVQIAPPDKFHPFDYEASLAKIKHWEDEEETAG